MLSDHLQRRRAETGMVLEFARIASLVDQRVKALFAQHGLDVTPQQSRVLMVLFEARAPLTARELAGRMGLAEPTMARFVKSLEAGGWLTRARDPGDQRCWMLHPTEQARAALPRFIAVSNAVMDRLFADLEVGDVARLAEQVSTLRAKLDAT